MNRMLSIRQNDFIDKNLSNRFFYLYTMIVHRWMRQVQLKINDVISEKSQQFFKYSTFPIRTTTGGLSSVVQCAAVKINCSETITPEQLNKMTLPTG